MARPPPRSRAREAPHAAPLRRPPRARGQGDRARRGSLAALRRDRRPAPPPPARGRRLGVPPAQLFAGGLDAIHCPCFLPFPALGIPFTITVHDLAYRLFPETVEPGNGRGLSRHLARAAARAGAVLVPSETVRGQVVALHGADPEKVRVGSNAPDPAFGPGSRDVPPALAALGVRRPYLLFLSTIEPRRARARLTRRPGRREREHLRGALRAAAPRERAPARGRARGGARAGLGPRPGGASRTRSPPSSAGPREARRRPRSRRRRSCSRSGRGTRRPWPRGSASRSPRGGRGRRGRARRGGARRAWRREPGARCAGCPRAAPACGCRRGPPPRRRRGRAGPPGAPGSRGPRRSDRRSCGWARTPRRGGGTGGRSGRPRPAPHTTVPPAARYGKPRRPFASRRLRRVLARRVAKHAALRRLPDPGRGELGLPISLACAGGAIVDFLDGRRKMLTHLAMTEIP